jgi:hypothetical protein
MLHKNLFQKIFLVILFAISTPIMLAASSAYLLLLPKDSRKDVHFLNDKSRYPSVLSSYADSFPSVSGEVVYADARSMILKAYLSKVGSVLANYTDLLVATADKYNLDYRLLTAIAIKESGACRVIPPGSHNCWGWGIHSKGTLMFDSYEEAIEAVSKGLKENYIDLGYITPDQIMKKYAHKDSTTWGDDVKFYMDILE